MLHILSIHLSIYLSIILINPNLYLSSYKTTHTQCLTQSPTDFYIHLHENHHTYTTCYLRNSKPKRCNALHTMTPYDEPPHTNHINTHFYFRDVESLKECTETNLDFMLER